MMILATRNKKRMAPQVISHSLRMLGVVFISLALGSKGFAFETTARQAILVDSLTGSILLEKDSDVPAPPASLSKLMTSYMVFEEIEKGALSLEDELPVSEKAWRMGGSKMFVEVGDKVSVEDLLRSNLGSQHDQTQSTHRLDRLCTGWYLGSEEGSGLDSQRRRGTTLQRQILLDRTVA